MSFALPLFSFSAQYPNCPFDFSSAHATYSWYTYMRDFNALNWEKPRHWMRLFLFCWMFTRAVLQHFPHYCIDRLPSRSCCPTNISHCFLISFSSRKRNLFSILFLVCLSLVQAELGIVKVETTEIPLLVNVSLDWNGLESDFHFQRQRKISTMERVRATNHRTHTHTENRGKIKMRFPARVAGPSRFWMESKVFRW